MERKKTKQKYALTWTKVLVSLVVISLLGAALVVLQNEVSAQSKTLYWGSQGADVVKLQQKLRDWGYYRGSVDGVYGAGTWRAVLDFQRRHGIVPDGVVGDRTRTALGLPIDSVQKAPPTRNTIPAEVSRGGVTNRDSVSLLARVIEGEAADEPFDGKVAVGAVILNRTQSASFPRTLSGVIYQPNAFECVSNGHINRPVSKESLRAAQLAMTGWDPTGGALFFWNPYKRVSAWIWSRPVVTQIGRHVFAH